jgi:hypothetical protein
MAQTTFVTTFTSFRRSKKASVVKGRKGAKAPTFSLKVMKFYFYTYFCLKYPVDPEHLY